MRWTIVSIVLFSLIGTGPPSRIAGNQTASQQDLARAAPGGSTKPSGRQTDTIEVGAAEDLGPVYMYGRRLKPPYVFSGVGGDTLFLNGYPVIPKRTRPNPFALLSEHEQQKLLEEARRSQAAAQKKYDVVKAMYESGKSYEECLDAYIDLCRNDPDVETVMPRSNGVRITYKNGESEEVTLPYDFASVPPYDAYKDHMRIIEKFEPWVQSGNMVAIGYAGGLQYNLWTPKVQLEKTNWLLGRLAAGDTLTREDVINTPLTNKGFRIQMSKPKVQPKPREE